MYEVDRHDRVVPLEDLPQPDPGAPIPALTAAENHLELAFITHADEEQIAVVRFVKPYAHMFGPPNDEALDGHPLAGRGLTPYRVSRVERSSWLRRLEKMNSVHPHHHPNEFAALTHYIFPFHDSTFECVAEPGSGLAFRQSCNGLARASDLCDRKT